MTTQYYTVASMQRQCWDNKGFSSVSCMTYAIGTLLGTWGASSLDRSKCQSYNISRYFTSE